MAKANKKVEKFTENEYSGARLLQKILDKSDYTDQRRIIKETFDRAAASPAIGIIKEIAEMTEIPKEDRQQALMSIYNAMIEAMEEVEKNELPDVKWKDRGKEHRYADPCQWVIDNYSSYNNGLTFKMLATHDPELYRILRKKKSEGKWSPDFVLPTQSVSNSNALDELGRSPTLQEIAEQAPPHIRELLRLYEVGKTRRRKEQKAVVNCS